jgi:hypothetical protein
MPLPEALTHSPLVILTGAGASTPLGLDTTERFLKRFYETQLRERVGDDQEFYAFMTNRLGVMGLQDIEVVLAGLEANADWAAKLASDHQFVAKVLSGNPEMLNVFGGWNSKLANAIYDEVIDHYGNVDAVKATALYKGLGLLEHQIVQDMVPLCTLPFFTLNYDTAVEEACRSLGVRLVDGFVEGPFTERRWDAKAYTDFVEVPDIVNCVLVKLHGSVRLGRREDGVLVELPAGLRRDPSPYRHAVLYPSLSPKALGDEPFRSNYRLLRACLRHARFIVVVGCSMRDQALNDLVRECMDENEELRLVAIAPDADVETLARQIGCDVSKLGVSRGSWEIEDNATLSAGRGLVLNAIRRWMMSAVSRSDSPHKFGTNVDL